MLDPRLTQDGLADPRLALEDDRSRRSLRVVDERAKHGELRLPADDLRHHPSCADADKARRESNLDLRPGLARTMGPHRSQRRRKRKPRKRRRSESVGFSRYRTTNDRRIL